MGLDMTITTYEADIVAWAHEQAQLVRTGNFELLDLDHIAEEIEDVGKSEQRELASRMVVLIAHLLKWQCQPDRQCRSWQITIRNQRHAIQHQLKQMPSLKGRLNDAEWNEIIWGDALYLATKETDLVDFPETCPWLIEDILSDGWMPISSTH